MPLVPPPPPNACPRPGQNVFVSCLFYRQESGVFLRNVAVAAGGMWLCSVQLRAFGSKFESLRRPLMRANYYSFCVPCC